MVLEMQDPKSGVKSQTQRLVITTIPHAITGKTIRLSVFYVRGDLSLCSERENLYKMLMNNMRYDAFVT